VSAVEFFHSLWPHLALDAIAVWFAKYGLAISVLAFFVGTWRATANLRRPRFFMLRLLFGAIVAMGITFGSEALLTHPRPFVVLHVAPLIAHVADNAFPSDHSTTAAFLAAALFFVSVPEACVASAAALLIGAARVYCLLHWPSDVIGGWAIGAASAAGVMLVGTRKM